MESVGCPDHKLILYVPQQTVTHRDVVIVGDVPHHVGVLPGEVQPHVGGEDLILLI